MSLGVMLAKKWDGEDVRGWWVSEKLDGVRAYWSGANFYSRNGNIFPAPDWFKKQMPRQPLDGELWAGRAQFQAAVSVVRNSNRGDDWKYITYMVFDAPEVKGGFEARYKAARKVIGPELNGIELVGMVKCKDKEHLLQELAIVQAAGGEGLMLRKPNSAYVKSRTDALLKVKTFSDEECIVVGHEKGTGRNANRLGALLCQTPDGRSFKIGTGLSDQQRNKPPKVGTVVTYRYQELSNRGMPRFPALVGERVDIDWKKYCKDYTPNLKPQPGPLKRAHTVLYSTVGNDSGGRQAQSEPPKKKPRKAAGSEDIGSESVLVHDGDDDDRPVCKYGAQCYRKSRTHLLEYAHPPALMRNVSDMSLKQQGVQEDPDEADDFGDMESPGLSDIAAMAPAAGTLLDQSAENNENNGNNGNGSDEGNSKPACKFGANCYRTNKAHLDKYFHPKRATEDDDGGDDNDTTASKKRGGVQGAPQGSGEGGRKVATTDSAGSTPTRGLGDEDMADSASADGDGGKPVCKFGAACYRINNKEHAEDFAHPKIKAPFTPPLRAQAAGATSSPHIPPTPPPSPANIAMSPSGAAVVAGAVLGHAALSKLSEVSRSPRAVGADGPPNRPSVRSCEGGSTIRGAASGRTRYFLSEIIRGRGEDDSESTLQEVKPERRVLGRTDMATMDARVSRKQLEVWLDSATGGLMVQRIGLNPSLLVRAGAQGDQSELDKDSPVRLRDGDCVFMLADDSKDNPGFKVTAI